MALFFKKHKLPKFPETLRPTFRRLCEPITSAALPDLKHDLERCIEQTEQLAANNPLLNRELLQKIGDRSRFLLGEYERFSTEQQALIIGAIRYFVIHEDTLPDERFATGLDDDARVINYVLEQLGIPDRFIELG